MDAAIDLERTAAVLRALAPDVVGLQEVDQRVTRSGGVAQADSLGVLLGMHAAFGAFMPYQGGEYGMAILSRHPILRTERIRLPEGNEPRIALLVEVDVPGFGPVHVVNVHFDWVASDAFRFAQVEALATALDSMTSPLILLGDFNDVPGSRTMTHWDARFATAVKSSDARFTFPSDLPRTEIDQILVAPREWWMPPSARVVDEPVASDHRPVVSVLRRR